MTFTTDIDILIRLGHGDTNRLRNIRDVIKHDNFITVVDKKYVESLISTHLKNQPLDGSEVNIESRTVVESKNNIKQTGRETVSTSSSLFSGSNNKKLGVLAGVTAAIALVVVIGLFASTSQTDITTVNIIPSQKIIVNVDETSYKNADIIFVSGNIKSVNGKTVEISIENTSGDKIWKEYVVIKNDGQFSTLVIAGGFGWDDSGIYVLNAQHNDLENKIKFSFSA